MTRFWSGKTLDNERRWRRFEFYECFLVYIGAPMLLLRVMKYMYGTRPNLRLCNLRGPGH